MNNFNWTAGPWFVEADDYSSFIWNGNYVICTVDYSDNTLDEVDEANAHLIAAAPELYSALDALLSHPDDIMPSRLWDEARRVLAKARGESND